MATHSSVLARRIPGTVEPGGLPSMGLHSWTRLKRQHAWPQWDVNEEVMLENTTDLEKWNSKKVHDLSQGTKPAADSGIAPCFLPCHCSSVVLCLAVCMHKASFFVCLFHRFLKNCDPILNIICCICSIFNMLICASETITTLLNGYTLNKIQR